MPEKVIELKHINVFFDQDGRTLKAVNDVSLDVERGDIYGVVGYSGAGKSTLVRVINLLEKPTSGKVVVNGETLFEKTDQATTVIDTKKLRPKRREIGMIFQHFNLLDEKTVIQNIEFALKHSKLKEKQMTEKAQKLLELVGLGERAKAYPAQLSGGQQQRVAIARALANDPEILISDEATSALDPKNTIQILDLLKRLNQELNLTVVLITHEMDAVKRIANKVAVMSEGKIIERGSLFDIFTNAQFPLTKTLVGTESDSQKAISILKKDQRIDEREDQSILHLTYHGNSISEPVTTKLYEDFEVETSIVYGNVDVLRDTPVGTLFVIMTGTAANRERAIEYLKDHDVTVSTVRLEGVVND